MIVLVFASLLSLSADEFEHLDRIAAYYSLLLPQDDYLAESMSKLSVSAGLVSFANELMDLDAAATNYAEAFAAELPQVPGAGNGTRTFYPSAEAVAATLAANYSELLSHAWHLPEVDAADSWLARLSHLAAASAWPLRGQWLWLATSKLRAELSRETAIAEIAGQNHQALKIWLENVEAAFFRAYLEHYDPDASPEKSQSPGEGPEPDIAEGLLRAEGIAIIEEALEQLELFDAISGQAWQYKIMTNGIALENLSKLESNAARRLRTSLLDWIDELLEGPTVPGLAGAVSRRDREAWVRTGVVFIGETSAFNPDIESMYSLVVPWSVGDLSGQQAREAALAALSALGIVFPAATVQQFAGYGLAGIPDDNLVAGAAYQFSKLIPKAETPIELGMLRDKLVRAVGRALSDIPIPNYGTGFDPVGARIAASRLVCDGYASGKLSWQAATSRLESIWFPAGDLWTALDLLQVAASNF